MSFSLRDVSWGGVRGPKYEYQFTVNVVVVAYGIYCWLIEHYRLPQPATERVANEGEGGTQRLKNFFSKL